MARPSNPLTRSELLKAGQKLFFETGYNGCGVQDITAAAGIPKGSFYNYFATKEAFAVEIIDDYWSEIEHEHGPLLYDARLQPMERIRSFFRILTAEHEKSGFKFGCLVGNMTLELSQVSENARQKLRSVIARWEDALAACLLDAKKRGELRPDADASELASFLVEAWEGAAMRAKVERRPMSYGRFEKYALDGLTA